MGTFPQNNHHLALRPSPRGASETSMSMQSFAEGPSQRRPTPKTALPSWRDMRPFGRMLTAPARRAGDQRAEILDGLKAQFLAAGFLVLRGYSGVLDLREVAEALGGIFHTDGEGKPDVYDVLYTQQGSTDFVKTKERVALHWDGFWCDFEAHVQVFQCLAAPRPGYGGESVFAHTTRVYRSASASLRADWDQRLFVYRRSCQHRTQEELLERLFGETRTYPLVGRHPLNGDTILRLRENDRDVECREMDPFGLGDWRPGRQNLAGVYFDLLQRLYSPRNCLYHGWQEGDIVLSDNQTMLHGRLPFSGERRLNRMLVNLPV